MKLKYRIVWSDFAKEDYTQILNFLQDNFGVNPTLNFLDKTEEVVDKIKAFPFSFPLSEQNTRLRKAVINENTFLLYRVLGRDTELLFFEDNRMKDTF